MKDSRILIIGSGLGGLLSGFLLSKEGFKVTILEKHRKFGGCLQTFSRDTYTFDTGMHYIGGMAPGQPLYTYWKYFGLTGKLDMMQMDLDGFDLISIADDTSASLQDFPLAQGFTNFRDQLLPFFPEAKSTITRYLKRLREIARSHPLYNLELPSRSFSDSNQSIPANFFLKELSSGIRHQASGIQLSGILAGNNILYAGNPTTTPLSLFALINHSFISSAWRLSGGSQQLIDILVDGITSHGGSVLPRKKVTGIRKSGELFFIDTEDGDQFESSRVVSNIHPANTLQLLKGISVQKAYRERITSLSNTTSVFSVYLGLKPHCFRYLNHNVYHHFTPNVWTDQGSAIRNTRNKNDEKRFEIENKTSTIENLESSFENQNWPRQFLLMTPPDVKQGAFANTAVVMAPMSFDEVRQWEESASGTRDKQYVAFKAKRSNQLLNLVYQKFPALQGAVVTIDISTPLTWRDYTGTPEGSMYGIARSAINPEKTSIFPRTKIPGLFFTGQNVNLHGALGVTIGAVMTCGEILGLPYVLKTVKNNQ